MFQQKCKLKGKEDATNLHVFIEKYPHALQPICLLI